MEYYGVPAVQLSDEELRRECAQAEATREWAFHNATDEQFQRYGIRMLELEQEYLRRQLKRQALGWRVVVDEVSRVGSTVRGLVAQMETRVDGYFVQAATALQAPAPMPALTAERSVGPDPRDYQVRTAPAPGTDDGRGRTANDSRGPAVDDVRGPAVDDAFPPWLDVGQPVPRPGATRTSRGSATLNRGRRALAAGLDRFRPGEHLARHVR